MQINTLSFIIDIEKHKSQIKFKTQNKLQTRYEYIYNVQQVKLI